MVQYQLELVKLEFESLLNVGGGSTSLTDGADVGVEFVVRVGSSRNHRDIVSLSFSDVVLSGSDDLSFLVSQELLPVSNPSDGSGDGEEDGEHISGESEGFVDHSSVEVDVGVQLLGDEVGVGKSDAFEFLGQVDEGLLANNLEDFLGDVLDDSSTGVVVLVYSVTESHQFSLFVLDIFNELGDIFDTSDRLEHSQNSFIGTSVERSVESTGGTSQRTVDVNSRGGEMSHGGSGAVKFVVGMENEENVESSHDTGVGFVLGGGVSIQHVEEILGC